MLTLLLHLSDGYLVGMLVWLGLLAAAVAGLVRLRRRWKHQPQRLRTVHAGLSAWLTLLLLTLLELGFAVAYDTTDSFDMTNVSHRWFQVHVQPDVRSLEFSDGSGIRYRDLADVTLRTPDGTRQVCFLGDSFTFGHGVPDVRDRFTNRLGQLLHDTPADSSPMVVSNLSWPGTDLFWVESVLEHVFRDGGRLDQAVYVMCLNDIEAFQDPRMTRSTELARFEPPTPLFRDTYFFNWMYFRTQLLLKSDARSYYSFVRDYYQGEPWQRFEQTLVRTRDLCRANHCEFTVLIFPFLHSLGSDYPFRDVHQQIRAACEAHALPCLDLEPVLTSHVSAGLTVNPFDAHPNARAHALAAEFLHQSLLSPRVAGPGE